MRGDEVCRWKTLVLAVGASCTSCPKVGLLPCLLAWPGAVKECTGGHRTTPLPLRTTRPEWMDLPTHELSLAGLPPSHDSVNWGRLPDGDGPSLGPRTSHRLLLQDFPDERLWHLWGLSCWEMRSLVRQSWAGAQETLLSPALPNCPPHHQARVCVCSARPLLAGTWGPWVRLSPKPRFSPWLSMCMLAGVHSAGTCPTRDTHFSVPAQQLGCHPGNILIA